MLCGHILLDLYHKTSTLKSFVDLMSLICYQKKTDNLRFILDGAILLEYARVHSKFNFQVKLLLMHFYSLIGM